MLPQQNAHVQRTFIVELQTSLIIPWLLLVCWSDRFPSWLIIKRESHVVALWFLGETSLRLPMILLREISSSGTMKIWIEMIKMIVITDRRGEGKVKFYRFPETQFTCRSSEEFVSERSRSRCIVFVSAICPTKGIIIGSIIFAFLVEPVA